MKAGFAVIALSLGTIGLWGLWGFFGKLAINRGMLGSSVFLAEVAVGAVLALAVTAWFLSGGQLGEGSFGAGAAPWRTGINVWGILSGLGLALGLLLFYLALESGKAAVVVPLTALYPVVAVLLSVLFLGERLTWLQWSGLGLALAGILLLVSGPVEGATPPS